MSTLVRHGLSLLLVGAGLGCSSTSSSSPAPTPTPTSTPISTERLDLAQFPEVCDAQLPNAGDATELREQTRRFGGPTPPAPPAPLDAGSDGGLPKSRDAVLATTGVVCATATDKPSCLKKFADATITEPSAWSSLDGVRFGAPPESVGYYYYVVSQGDDVRVIATSEALRAALVPIDSVPEAKHATGGPRGAMCQRMRTDPDGYSFFREVCSGQVVIDGVPKHGHFEVVVKVSRDGKVTESQKAGPFFDPNDETRCGLHP